MAIEMDCQVEILREIQLDATDDVHLTAKGTNNSAGRTRRISTSLVVHPAVDDGYDQVGSQEGPGTALVSGASANQSESSQRTKSTTEPIHIAPVKKAVSQTMGAHHLKGQSDVGDEPLSSSFSLNTLVQADSLNSSSSSKAKPNSEDSTRSSTPLRVLPAGRRYCLGVLLGSNCCWWSTGELMLTCF